MSMNSIRGFGGLHRGSEPKPVVEQDPYGFKARDQGPAPSEPGPSGFLYVSPGGRLIRNGGYHPERGPSGNDPGFYERRDPSGLIRTNYSNGIFSVSFTRDPKKQSREEALQEAIQGTVFAKLFTPKDAQRIETTPASR